MGPLDKYILADDALKATENGFELRFQSHWYRSLPLSCMEFSIKINGQNIAQEQLTVSVNDKVFQYAQLENLDKEYVYILDKLVVNAHQEKSLQKGQSYQVELNFDLHIPYILVGPQSKPLLAGSKVEKTLICL